MVYWRRRQPEPQARRLLGREPAWLVSAHQGGADLRLCEQPVQSQIRDLRDLLRSAVDGRARDTERAVRPPHGHAGAAALGLCGNACEAVRPVGRVRKWHEAAVRKCPLLGRLWGLSGHRSASTIYEYTPLAKRSPETVVSDHENGRFARETTEVSFRRNDLRNDRETIFLQVIAGKG